MIEKIPKNAITKNKRILWDKVPGFVSWFQRETPYLTNVEVQEYLISHYNVNMTRSAVNQIRLRFNVPMSKETKIRAHSHGAAKLRYKEEEPQLSPEQQFEIDLARRESLRLTARQTFFEMLGQKIISAVHNLPTMAPPPPKFPVIKKGVDEEEVILMISDVQAGLTVDARESGGLGSFDTDTLLKSIQYYQESVINILTRYHPNVKTLNVFFLGDIVEGETIYGGQLREIDMNLIQQTMFCWDHFAHMLNSFTGIFKEVKCRGVVGNHGRIGKKGEHSPMSNFDYLIYKMLEDRLRYNKRITWKVSESWWDIAEIQGWKWLLVHGDDSGQGWAGIPFYAVNRHKTRYREMFKQLKEEFGDFDFMCAGHHSILSHFNNIWLNGSWPGGTEFSLKRLQLGDPPAQWILGMHKKHGVTWARPIQLRPHTLFDKR